MGFSKAFNIGYVLLLVVLVFVYFIMPPEYTWYAIVALMVLFGAFQLIVSYRVRHKEK